MPLAEHVREAHQLDELEQRVGRVAEDDAAAAPTGRQLESRERVHCHGVGVDAGDVAGHGPAPSREDGADALAQTGKVRARDRAADRERDRRGPGLRHRRRDGLNTRNSAVGDPRRSALTRVEP